MNLYEKIQYIKMEIVKANLKKTGRNKFANFSYYELSDFLPTVIKKCEEQKVCTYVTYDNEMAKLIAVNSEEPTEKIEISSPMRELQLKGCNEIQSLGGVETYSRRYLYMSLFDITENDMFDGTNPESENKYVCCDCGTPFSGFTDKNGKKWSAGQTYHFAEKANEDGKARCKTCRLKREVLLSAQQCESHGQVNDNPGA